FGYTVTLWFPLVAGYGAIYYPNPRDAKAIAKLMDEEQGTILVSPPTFFQIYLRQWPEGTGKWLRLAMAGAEKLKPSLAAEFERRFGFPLLEGYGTTELSPAVSFNTFDFRAGDHVEIGRKPGSIGHPLPGVAVKTIDLEDGHELEAGEEGLICVKGPNVMLGYLGAPEKSQEVIVDGWYQTGDVGRIDEDGFIEITDRLSRFSKLGGEMVPHVRIESELQDIAPDVRFAVTALPCERKGEKLVVLHTRLPDSLSADAMRERLQARGLPNLFIPRGDCFVEVDEIPLLASGKLDLCAVRRLAEERLVGSGARD
ncbi:MAG TPA: AMP-binding protein, partial [Planctomycetota bacterium]|nr:AMP-binding protein [Planctomycetota bacterium]